MANNLYYINSLIIEKFSSALRSEGFSKVTIKNYITDVNQFLAWRINENIYSTDEEVLGNYILHISKSFSKASIKRKLSAIKKYIAFEKKQLSTPSFDTKNKFSKFTYVPLSIGVLLILALPLVNRYLYSEANSLQKEQVSIQIPSSTVTNTNKVGQAYSFEDSKGIKVVLTEEPLSAPATNNLSLTNSLENAQNSFTFQGTATINKGKTSAILVSDLINPTSFIFVTPRSSTGNQILYIEEQKEGYAIVKVDNPSEEDIHIQWKVDNTEVYHSIL